MVLAVHELTANGVRHAAGTGRLALQEAAGSLPCQVTSEGECDGSWPVRRRRGLWVVHQVTDEFTVSPCEAGCQVGALFAAR